ncbi:MAG: G8 domain-containing protein [Planctomycetes bacterium]|nr:G8 domain-containing protein [Planctomycetota bacterium]
MFPSLVAFAALSALAATSPSSAQVHAASGTPGLGGSQHAACPRPGFGSQRWSDPATWPTGHVPALGECVVIPAGQKIWLDVTPPPLGGVTIDGTLTFACADLELVADRVEVRGELQVGSAAHPFHRRATVTLTDDFGCATERRSLVVTDGGTLRLVGEARATSWTKLAQHAPAGASRLVLDELVGWRVGDRVVIASSDFDPGQTEVRTVVAAHDTVLDLDRPVTFLHFGEHVAANVDGHGVDERAEIGLLSRAIVVRGTPELDAQGRTVSGAVLARGTTVAPKLEIAWTAFQDLGDEGVAGRHALFVDALGDAPGSYVRGSTFERSKNRAVEIAATRFFELSDNVVHDTLGHALHVADDAVRGVAWRRNLVVRTRAARSGFATEPSDLAPAAFFLRHPDFVCEDNVAAGSDAYGFELAVQNGEPTPQKWFARNTAHSCGEIGFFQDTRPHPSSPSIWSDLVAWKNRRYAVWWRSYGAIVLANLRAADNRCAIYLASEGIQNDFVQTTGIADLHVIGGLIVGESKNVGTPQAARELVVGRSLSQLAPNPPVLHLPDWDVLTGVEVYDGLLSVDGTTFVNFYDLAVPGWIDRKAGAFSQVQHNSPWAVDPRNHVANVSFVKSRRIWFRTPLGAYATGPVLGDDGIASTVLVDDDGSLTGLAGSRVQATHALLPTNATFASDWNAWVTAGAPVQSVAQLEFANWMPLVNGQPGAALLLLRRDSTGAAHELVQPIFGAAQTHTDRYTSNVTTGESYTFEYLPGTPQTEWSRVFSLSLQYVEPSRSVQVAIPLPPISSGSVEIDGQSAYAATSLADLALAPSGFFYDAATGFVHVKLTTAGSGSTMFDGQRTTATVFAF